VTNLQKKVVEVLRTTTKKQGSGSLVRGDKYCALAVVAIEALGMDEETVRRNAVAAYEKIDSKLGRTFVCAVYPLRDFNQLSFQQIADRIEESPGYFFSE
jgi:hypothetical protein